MERNVSTYSTVSFHQLQLNSVFFLNNSAWHFSAVWFPPEVLQTQSDLLAYFILAGLKTSCHLCFVFCIASAVHLFKRPNPFYTGKWVISQYFMLVFVILRVCAFLPDDLMNTVLQGGACFSRKINKHTQSSDQSNWFETDGSLNVKSCLGTQLTLLKQALVHLHPTAEWEKHSRATTFTCELRWAHISY